MAQTDACAHELARELARLHALLEALRWCHPSQTLVQDLLDLGRGIRVRPANTAGIRARRGLPGSHAETSLPPREPTMTKGPRRAPPGACYAGVARASDW